jgi:hypothetical protein
MLKTKLFIIFAFLALSVGTFFVSNQPTEAHSKNAIKQKTDILETAASYKTWKQIDKKPEIVKVEEPTMVLNSSIAG